MDEKQVQQVAELARLEISHEEALEYATQLSQAIAHFDQISKIDTQGVEPLATPTEIEIYWRKDEARKEYSAEEMLANAPQKTGNLFTVPPVV